MEIGKPIRTIIVEPVEDPFEAPSVPHRPAAPLPTPTPAPDPVRTPEKVPA